MKSKAQGRGLRWPSRRFVRFLIVGGFNTAFGFAVFAVIYAIANSHRIAIVIGTVVGIAFNFFTTGSVVFGNWSAGAALPFVLGYGAVLILNLLLADLLIGSGLGALPAQAVALPFVVVASYFINARLVFRR
ncbi:GtrA family protein [Bradyrhizobium sp. AZCC 2289]|uniref:GtrA family protein n=1 Tax=Bradyrhizobium sp. AZCC 2289 TaxID=3117026 RepID=UPI002FF0E54D